MANYKDTSKNSKYPITVIMPNKCSMYVIIAVLLEILLIISTPLSLLHYNPLAAESQATNNTTNIIDAAKITTTDTSLSDSRTPGTPYSGNQYTDSDK
jgi:hypothetical protein